MVVGVSAFWYYKRLKKAPDEWSKVLNTLDRVEKRQKILDKVAALDKEIQ